MNSLEIVMKKRGEEINNILLQSIKEIKEKKILDMYKYAIGTGQKLRPSLVLLSCEAVGGNSSKILPAAIAVELLHKFTLVHDDIIDKDELRRGLPTFHKKYGWKYGVYIGDLLCSMSFTILKKLKKNYDDKTILKCYKILSETYDKLCIGELEDIFSSKKRIISEEEYFNIVYLKSASLLETSMKLGALLGDGTEKEIEMLSNYGKYFAFAMQILNDVKDTIGTEKRRYKEKSSDIQESKWNITLIHSANNSSKKDREEVIKIMNKSRVKTKDEIDKVIKILEKTKSFNYARQKVEENTAKARESIKSLRDSDAKKVLLRLAELKTDEWYWNKK